MEISSPTIVQSVTAAAWDRESITGRRRREKKRKERKKERKRKILESGRKKKKQFSSLTLLCAVHSSVRMKKEH